ncbi:wax ester synthase/diacylglycerol acyltransferase 4-like [Cornus florida]|uniref:wax ester synthase/diacylglycerol acyltransferase 4-like n=1 Tax=Cornus florida TaxID=4283 RepID=UPI002899DFFC|nr:wax ester synthase/diacylglycerol acyltransferase 4-like [Cornus florida]
MEFKQEELSEPVSPTGQYLNSPVLSISIIGVLELEVPIDDSPTMALLKDVFLPINPRFSSIMVRDENGVKHWKRVEVKPMDHVKFPTFPAEKSVEFYDEYLNDYISKIAMDEFPQSRPLWEIHIIKYPTTNAAGTLIFKLHHSLGDGYSLMGALLSCLQRADNPSLPLTFPKLQTNATNLGGESGSIFTSVPRFFSGLVNTVSDFGWSLLKSTVVEDDRTPIRSGDAGMEFRPITITTMTFSLDRIKQIKTDLRVSINDVITGTIFYGTQLYMQQASCDELRNAHSTALVLLNTRNIAGYKSVDEMVMKPQTVTKYWGNQFAFLHVPIPELNETDSSDPICFIYKAHQMIKKKRNSGAVYLTGRLLETLRKLIGPERTARYMYGTIKNSSMALTNMIGPVEQMALSNHPVRSFYFMVVGVPLSLTITMVSYTGKLRVAVGTKKGLIDPQRFKSCIEKAFDMMFNAEVKSA